MSLPGLKLILPLLVLVGAPFALSALDTTLEWRIGTDIIQMNETVTPTPQGFSVVMTTSAGEFDRLDLDRKRSTLVWERRFAGENDDIRAERTDSQVRITGTYQGKSYDKTHDFGNLPWYQLQEIAYEELYAAGTVSSRFWTIDRKTLKPTEFSATRLEEDAIPIMGQTVQAVKYRLNVHGIPAFLFTAHFWLRKSDGRFLKLEVPAVLGLPRSSVELTGES